MAPSAPAWITSHGRGFDDEYIRLGMTILSMSFVPLLVVPNSGRFGAVAAIVALLVSAALLAVGSAAVFPFEMDTVVSLAGNRLVATHYGFYNTIVGVGILTGNLATGALLQAARDAGADELLWGGLALVGLAAGLALHRLDRRGHLTPEPLLATPARG